jgi:hypothetical protein
MMTTSRKKTKKRTANMKIEHAEDIETTNIALVDNTSDAQLANQEQVGELLGKLTPRQNKLLDNLRRLFHSLRGPEDVLDEDNYSRPFPPQIRDAKSRED